VYGEGEMFGGKKGGGEKRNKGKCAECESWKKYRNGQIYKSECIKIYHFMGKQVDKPRSKEKTPVRGRS